MNTQENNPLVSIIVITYNSAKYVLETLESARAQTYQNIELIVSDDCSTDDTVEICRKWIDEYKDRFVRTELVTVEKNTGIPANCNRGLWAAKGEWIKYCAGDDILEKNILQVYIDYAKSKPDVSCLYSNIIEFKDTLSEENLLPVKDISNHSINKPEISAQEQFDILLRSNPVWAASLFIKRDALIKIDGYDERYKFFEDRPVLLSLTKKGYKIHFLNVYGAYYRRHKKSIQKKEKNVFISGFEEDRQRFFIKEYIDYFTKREQYKMKFILAKNMTIKKITGNSNNLLIKSISKILELPLKYF